MNETLASFLLDRAARRPELLLGVSGDQVTLGAAVETGRRVAGDLAATGLGPGDRVAVIGTTSTAYLQFWIGCQLAGVEPALINPTYPDDLLAAMLDVLAPAAIAPPDGGIGERTGQERLDLGFGELGRGPLILAGRTLPGLPAEHLPGLERDVLDTAGYMHTSGTTGLPKFCAQSHRYHLRLGRLVADQLAIGPHDRVLAPLPMFHVNPLGYGFLGALTGLADLVATASFPAGSFWSLVRDERVTVLIMHAPPVEAVKRRTTATDAQGHQVRAMFYADERFLETYDVPVAMSCYGSTEVGGLSHVWQWRRGERAEVPEGASRYAGHPRHDLEHRLSEDGEILVRGREPGVLFSGYLRDGVLDPGLDTEGWFHTGDLGRHDEHGRLIFIERRAESIRVKGEYVPIDHVEEAFAGIAAFSDLALWKREGQLGGDEVVLYVVADAVPLDVIAATSGELPTFMRPAAVARVARIPRDAGAGKVQRRRLPDAEVLEWVPC